MTLTHLPDSTVLSSTVALVHERRRLTAALVEHLAEIDQRRLHLRASYSSLYDFCTNKLRMSPGPAYRHINGARLAQRFPVVLEQLRDGSLSLSGLELLRKHLTPDNHAELFAAAAGSSKSKLSQMLAVRFPKPDVPDRIAPTGGEPLSLSLSEGTAGSKGSSSAAAPAEVRGRVQPLSESRYGVQFTASSELCSKLERALDLMSHSNPKRQLHVLFERALDLLLAKLERQRHGKTTRPRQSRGVRHGDISAATKREVDERDGRQCTYVGPDGRRCTAKAFLQYDHTLARGRGGGGESHNIAEMCFGHNKLRAEDEYGREFVDEKIAARQATATPKHDAEASRSSGSGNRLRQRRGRTEAEEAIFDKLHKALMGMQFRSKPAAEALEHISKQWPLTSTPLDELICQALWVLVPAPPRGQRR